MLGSRMLRPQAASGGRQLSEDEVRVLRKRTQQALLATGMLLSGTVNTLALKGALSTVSEGELFDHPVVMSGAMFLGEITCFFCHHISQYYRGRVDRKSQRVPPHVFSLPAFCDILSTSIMNLGLTMTSASTYQMLRGSVIIFTGALSATYLRRRQWSYHWLAIFLVFCGVLTVGWCNMEMAAAAAEQQQQQPPPPAPSRSPSVAGAHPYNPPAEPIDVSRQTLGMVLVVGAQVSK